MSDVNAVGAVVGYWKRTASGGRAVYWDAQQGAVDLHPPGAGDSSALSLNDMGEVVGTVDHRAVLFQGAGAYQSIDTFSTGDQVSLPRVINNAGEVCGNRFTAGFAPLTAFSWSSSSGTTEIGTLGGSWSFVTDMNEGGQVVGQAATSGGQHAILWHAGTLTDLGTLGGANSAAHAVNDNGVVAGSAQRGDGVTHATVWVDGVPTDLDPDNPEGSEARDINDSGHVVDVRIVGGERRGTLWRDGEAIDLGFVVPGETIAINELDIVVADANLSPHRGVLWINEEDGPVDLPPLSGDSATLAAAINAAGVVVGWSADGSTATAVTWDVVAPQPSPGDLISSISTCLDEVAASHGGDRGPLRSLEAGLSAAQRQLDVGAGTGAVHQLQAFLNRLEAFVGAGRLTEEEASCAHDLAQQAVATLSHCFTFTLSGDAPVEAPAFQVENRAEDLSIAKLLFHIGDEAYYFDKVVFDPSPTGPTELAPLGISGVKDPAANDIIFEFTNFTPGASFGWLTDVDDDVVGDFSIDHRLVFFNNGDAQNASLTVWFSDGWSGTIVLPDGDPEQVTYVFDSCTSGP